MQKKKEDLFKERRVCELNKKQTNRKQDILPALTTVIKDPTTPIRKHANEFKVYEKTVRTAIKQHLSPDLNTVDYAI